MNDFTKDELTILSRLARQHINQFRENSDAIDVGRKINTMLTNYYEYNHNQKKEITMNRFMLKHQYKDDQGHITSSNVQTFEEDCLYEILGNIKLFLLATGFAINGDLEIVKDE